MKDSSNFNERLSLTHMNSNTVSLFIRVSVELERD